MNNIYQIRGIRTALFASLFAWGVCCPVTAAESQDRFPKQRSTPATGQPTVSGQTIDLESLREQLEPHGWRVERSEFGDLLLFPGARTESGTPVSLTKGTGGATIDISTLRGLLVPHGWRVEQTAGGDALLFPAAIQGKAEGESVKPDTEPEAGAKVVDIDVLRAMLEPHGWIVKRDAQGGLLLIPGEGKKRASVRVKPAQSTASIDVDTLRAMLGPHGWRVDRAADGSVILIPRKSEEQTIPRKSEKRTVEQPKSPIFQQQDVDRLRSLLGPHGWAVERNAGGDIILRPESRGTGEVSLDESRWVGVIVEPVSQGDIELPVNTWSEVHTLASSWVETVPKRSLTVGKIREINRIYVVSVVADDPPHLLKHQLVIRKDDGHIFPIY